MAINMKKKIAIIGIALLLVMSAVTCGEWLPGEGVVEYTDVVYSEDGSRVTVYLDGVTVPVPKSQRAMSRDLSRMAYDYLEVIFIGPAGTVRARSQWELGQQASISGVARGTDATGINYTFVPATAGGAAVAPAAGLGVALMAVGTKSDKTLLGVGQIAEVDYSASTINGGVAPGGGWATTGMPNTITATIFPKTQSVTFYLESVKTGLLVGNEVAVGVTPVLPQFENTVGVVYDSLVFNKTATIKTNATRTPLGGSQYPMYALPTTTATNDEYQSATYTFGGAVNTFKTQLIFNKTAAPFGNVERRIPRYLENGRYLFPKSAVDTKTQVYLVSVAADATRYGIPIYAEATKNVVPLGFERRSTGIFSFYIDVPVVLMTKALGTNGGDIPGIVWRLRTGFGSELYSLDDGAASGGCVLMGVGVGGLDFLNIEWDWLQ